MLLTNISFNNQTEVFAYESDLSPPQWQTYDTAYTVGGRNRNQLQHTTQIIQSEIFDTDIEEEEDEFAWLLPNHRIPGVDFELYAEQPYVRLPEGGTVWITADGDLYVGGYMESELKEVLPVLESMQREALDERQARLSGPTTFTIISQTMLNVADYSNVTTTDPWRFSTGRAQLEDGTICDIFCIQPSEPHFPDTGTTLTVAFDNEGSFGDLSVAAINYIMSNTNTGSAAMIVARHASAPNMLTEEQKTLLRVAMDRYPIPTQHIIGNQFMDLPEYFYEDIQFFEHTEENVRIYREDVRDMAAFLRLEAMLWNSIAATSIIPTLGRSLADGQTQTLSAPNHGDPLFGYISEPFFPQQWGTNLRYEIIFNEPRPPEGIIVNGSVFVGEFGRSFGGGADSGFSEEEMLNMFSEGIILYFAPPKDYCKPLSMTFRITMDVMIPNGAFVPTQAGTQNIWINCPGTDTTDDFEEQTIEFTFTVFPQCIPDKPEPVIELTLSDGEITATSPTNPNVTFEPIQIDEEFEGASELDEEILECITDYEETITVMWSDFPFPDLPTLDSLEETLGFCTPEETPETEEIVLMMLYDKGLEEMLALIAELEAEEKGECTDPDFEKREDYEE
ncbi:MAG: hypothetical protein FWG64_07345 [Firmicutes bacterium]|nr:hypothetical protein [Bacillota bacterium]